MPPDNQEALEYLMNMLDRGNDVREWPEDEAKVYRDARDFPNPDTGFYDSFEMCRDRLRLYRAKKIWNYFNDNKSISHG